MPQVVPCRAGPPRHQQTHAEQQDLADLPVPTAGRQACAESSNEIAAPGLAIARRGALLVAACGRRLNGRRMMAVAAAGRSGCPCTPAELRHCGSRVRPAARTRASLPASPDLVDPSGCRVFRSTEPPLSQAWLAIRETGWRRAMRHRSAHQLAGSISLPAPGGTPRSRPGCISFSDTGTARHPCRS